MTTEHVAIVIAHSVQIVDTLIAGHLAVRRATVGHVPVHVEALHRERDQRVDFGAKRTSLHCNNSNIAINFHEINFKMKVYKTPQDAPGGSVSGARQEREAETTARCSSRRQTDDFCTSSKARRSLPPAAKLFRSVGQHYKIV